MISVNFFLKIIYININSGRSGLLWLKGAKFFPSSRRTSNILCGYRPGQACFSVMAAARVLPRILVEHSRMHQRKNCAASQNRNESPRNVAGKSLNDGRWSSQAKVRLVVYHCAHNYDPFRHCPTIYRSDRAAGNKRNRTIFEAKLKQWR